MMKQRGGHEWKGETVYSRTENEKLHEKIKEKKERGAGVGIAATSSIADAVVETV
jgi:hypothetical protein